MLCFFCGPCATFKLFLSKIFTDFFSPVVITYLPLRHYLYYSLLSQYLPSLFSPLCPRSVASQWDFPSETWSEGWKQEAGDPDWLSLTFGVALSAAHFSFTLLLSLHTSGAFLFHYFLCGFPFLSSVFCLLVLHLFWHLFLLCPSLHCPQPLLSYVKFPLLVSVIFFLFFLPFSICLFLPFSLPAFFTLLIPSFSFFSSPSFLL